MTRRVAGVPADPSSTSPSSSTGALAHCHDNNIDPETLVRACLYPDMLPLRSRCSRWRTIRIGATEAAEGRQRSCRRWAVPTEDYRSPRQKRVADARAGRLASLTAAEVNDLWAAT